MVLTSALVTCCVLACALAVVTRGADRMAVGLGMIPRGEEGLIFAGMGPGGRCAAARGSRPT